LKHFWFLLCSIQNLFSSQVLLLDQRGCGLSSPFSSFDISKIDVKKQTDLLRLFLADSIVKDCEIIRKLLLGRDQKWTVLGQSYGGFVIFHYLSYYPDAIEKAMFSGGVPPIGISSVQDVYLKTYQSLLKQNEEFFKKFPFDKLKMIVVCKFLDKIHSINRPGSSHLSTRRFLQLGVRLGTQTGFESLHYLLETALCWKQKSSWLVVEIDDDCESSISSPNFVRNQGLFGGGWLESFLLDLDLPTEILKNEEKLISFLNTNDENLIKSLKNLSVSVSFENAIVSWSPFENHELYALLQELIYVDSESVSSTKWAASEVGLGHFPQFHHSYTTEEDSELLKKYPIPYFTGFQNFKVLKRTFSL
jgi:pimeloyl-ACP methyl ester carboxylesterase